MLDITFIREHAEELQQAVQDREGTLNIQELLTVDKQRVQLLQETQEFRHQQKLQNDTIASAKKEQKKELIADMKTIAEQLKTKDAELKKIEKKYTEIGRASCRERV